MKLAKILQKVATKASSAATASPASGVAALAKQEVCATPAALRIVSGFATINRPIASLPPGSARRTTLSPRCETRWSYLNGVRSFGASACPASEFEIKAPFLSDQVPIANGHLGEVEEICFQVGDIVDEGDSVVILETHKASLHIKAEKHDRVKITEVLVEEGQDIYELQPVIKCVPA